VFTFNDFNANTGVLRKAPTWLVGLGWSGLVLASLASLLLIREGHRLYRRYIKILKDDRQVPNANEQSAVNLSYLLVQVAEWVMIGSFLVGIAVLAASYISALSA
jgi:hypothetical protein